MFDDQMFLYIAKTENLSNDNDFEVEMMFPSKLLTQIQNTSQLFTSHGN